MGVTVTVSYSDRQMALIVKWPRRNCRQRVYFYTHNYGSSVRACVCVYVCACVCVWQSASLFGLMVKADTVASCSVFIGTASVV